MAAARLLVVAIALSGSACGTDGNEAPDGEEDGGGLLDPGDVGCPDIFHQGRLPEYRVDIAPGEWTALEDEFLNRAEREAAGLDPKPYHPVRFEHDGVEVPRVMLRLKGESSWWETIAFDERPKMQFVIAFNEIAPDGRFFGVRKLELDMPRTDASFLRQRLALYYLRVAGIDAQCANSARLVINGEYYGLYTNLERLDKEFLQRVFPGAAGGDLWKGARTIKTNEETFTWERLDAFWQLTSIDELEGLADLDASIREWAGEAMIPHGDGYYMGRANFYLYDHPERGFVWIPHDLDAAFDFIAADTSPMFPEASGRNPRERRHYALVMADAGWRGVYVEHLADAFDRYDVDALEARVDVWSAQIAESAAEDPMKPFSIFDHEFAVASLRDYMRRRAEAVDDWLDCRENGGVDGDGDGFDFCYDCADDDPAMRPGAAEICNGFDDDCDTQTDEDAVDGGTTCE